MKLLGVEKFLTTVRALRDPETGCPWDKAQTHESLMKYFVEELHEFLEALREKGPAAHETWEELGDVMLQVALHTELAREKGYTDFDRVCDDAAEKLIRRHPHVFDPAFPKFKTPEEVSAAWEQIKARSKQTKAAGPQEPASTSHQVNSVPKSLPALVRASRMGEKAASFGFDWPDAKSVLDKIVEESQELKADAESDPRAFEELGDLFFAASQYARKRGWDPEQVLMAANDKFGARIEAMDQVLRQRGSDWKTLSIEELEAVWQSVKTGT